jgi:hypothetical protein
MAFGMNDMLADMLKKAIPQEVQDMLTAERLKEIGDKANAFVADIRGSLDRIEARLVVIEARLENPTIEEGSVNDGNSSERKPRARKSTGSGAAI